MKGTKAHLDPMVESYQQFYRKIYEIRDQIDDEVLGRLGAEYADDVKQGKDINEIVAELKEKALRWQSKRQHREQCDYFNTAEMVANRPGITVLEACHVLSKHYYMRHHQVKGDPEVLSKGYNQIYENTHLNQIQNRQIQAAKDLFGE